MSSPKVEHITYMPIPYDLWRETNREDLERDFIALYGEKKKFAENCDICHGEGYRECDLGHEHDCDECDGSGEIDLLEEYMSEQYADQVQRDRKCFLRYQEEMKNAS